MTQFVDFAFSAGGVICAVAGALVWLQVRKHSVGARRLLIAVVIGYALAAIYPIGHAATWLLTRGLRPFASSDVPSNRTAVVILGSGSFSARDWDGKTSSVPDRSGAARIVEAARVYHLIKPEWVISSGGRVYADDPDAPSGETMRDMLVALGVPASRILLETESRNTHDEAVIVRRMLESLPADDVVLVTVDLHMPRSLGAFRAQGIDAIPAIARRPVARPPWNVSFLPSDSGLMESNAVARELLGICYYALRGWYRFA